MYVKYIKQKSNRLHKNKTPAVPHALQIVNGERASYSAPKFARMQDRTRSQMLEDLVNNLQNHAETGQIPKPYR